jgi:hypothetical protein
MDEKRRRDTSQSNGSLVPAVDGHLGGVQYIFSEDDRVGSGPAYIDANKVERECSVSRETCTVIEWGREEKGKTYQAGRHSR